MDSQNLSQDYQSQIEKVTNILNSGSVLDKETLEGVVDALHQKVNKQNLSPCGSDPSKPRFGLNVPFTCAELDELTDAIDIFITVGDLLTVSVEVEHQKIGALLYPPLAVFQRTQGEGFGTQ